MNSDDDQNIVINWAQSSLTICFDYHQFYTVCSDISVIRINVAKLISVMAKTQIIKHEQFFKRANQDIAAVVNSIYNIYNGVLIISSVTFHRRWNWIIAINGSKLQVRHAALIINFPKYIALLSTLGMIHWNLPYKHYNIKVVQCIGYLPNKYSWTFNVVTFFSHPGEFK